MTEDDQERRAIDLIKQHSQALAAQARELLASEPDAQFVGVIFASDSTEAAHYREAMTAMGEAVPEDTGVVGLVPREHALALLRDNAPATLDWLDSEPGVLPIVAATEHGMKLGSVRFQS